MSECKVQPNIGGVYTDPNHSPITASANLYHLPAPWYGGIRILGRQDPSSKDFLCIGNDDGIHWWTLKGTFTEDTTPTQEVVAKIDMDFTPKAPGVGLLQCGFQANKGNLHFYQDDGSTIGNTWSRLVATDRLELEPQVQHAAFNDVNGLYVDPDLFQKNSFAGIRVVSDRIGKFLGDEITVIGTDDGEEWFAMSEGTFTNRRRGEFQLEGNDAKCSSGTIQWNSFRGTTDCKWIKMTTKMDLHSLPKQSAVLS